MKLGPILGGGLVELDRSRTRARLLRLGLGAGLLLVVLGTGCQEDSSAPAIRPADLILGYWGITAVVIDGEETYRGPGNEGYWVIYGNQTACLIELLPSGEYERDSSAIYELEGANFVMRSDLDPIPISPLTMTYGFSAQGDTLYFSAAATEAWPAAELTFARQESIPDCGCVAIP